MKETTYTVRSISADEIQRLLGQNARTVFLLLCLSERNGEPDSCDHDIVPDMISDAMHGFIPGLMADRISERSSGRIPDLSDLSSAKTSFSVMNDAHHLEPLLANYLHQLGIPAHVKGYEYLKKAVEFSMKNPSVLCALTKELYPDIARSCGSNAKNVERGIRHAIEVAWNRGELPLQEEWFAGCIGRPTNGEFIAVVTEKIRQIQAGSLV